IAPAGPLRRPVMVDDPKSAVPLRAMRLPSTVTEVPLSETTPAPPGLMMKLPTVPLGPPPTVTELAPRLAAAGACDPPPPPAPTPPVLASVWLVRTVPEPTMLSAVLLVPTSETRPAMVRLLVAALAL